MYCCLLLRRPLAFNKWRPESTIGQAYRTDIRTAFTTRYGSLPSLTGNLYGLVYCFYRSYNVFTDADADNISKPVWDCLGSNFLYEDDKQIRFRIAACYDLAKNQLTDLDVTGLPDDVRDALLNALTDEAEKQVVYIECGVFDNEMIRFNLR
jgi:Holliday junction resolvase RusA-like endonuclease